MAMSGERMQRESDRAEGALRKCYFCRKPRRAERLTRVSYLSDDNALPIEVWICVPCERETWGDQ